jgi:hypothetical protein
MHHRSCPIATDELCGLRVKYLGLVDCLVFSAVGVVLVVYGAVEDVYSWFFLVIGKGVA